MKLTKKVEDLMNNEENNAGLEAALKLHGVAGCKALVKLQEQGVHCHRLSLREKEITQEAVVELDERLSALESKKHSAKVSEKLLRAYESFLGAFELVFDNDWEMTLGRIADPDFISEKGTFLRPGVDDESNNWANRGALLAAYRELIDCLGK